MRCCKPVTVAGSIRETLLHAPTTMLYHWNIIQFHNKQNHRELMLTPLFFTSYENYLRSSKSFQVHSFQVSLNWIKKFGYQKPTKYGQFMFYEVVKNDMVSSKETSFNNTISSTLSFITVLSEDLPGGTCQGYPAQPGLTWKNRRLPSQPGLTWRNQRIPSPTRINLTLCLWFHPSVRAKRVE
jgi:hypothetical protein